MKTVGILVFDDVEVSTFAHAAALFSTTRHTSDSQPLYRIQLIAQNMRPVTCAGGFEIQPQATFRDHMRLDILLVPGDAGYAATWSDSRVVELLDVMLSPEGKGVRRERYNRTLLNWIRDQVLRVEKVIGIGTGVVLLAECGLLAGWKAAIHDSVLRWMQAHYPHVRPAPKDQIVDTGYLLTAVGWNSAFEASLHVIAKSQAASTAVAASSRTWVSSVRGNRILKIPV